MLVSIHQPNYLPWLGYLSKICKSDVFIFLDNVQFSKRSVGARNYIISRDSKRILLSVSVKKSLGAYLTYNQLPIDYGSHWNIKHLNKIKNAYCKHPYFNEYFHQFETVLKTKHELLSHLNISIVEWILNLIECKTKLYVSSQLNSETEIRKNERNIELCTIVGADQYLSGMGAKKYNKPEVFEKNKIELMYHNYIPFEYNQHNKIRSFEPNLCFLDALFNVGADGIRDVIY